jgi:hypothetical protein
MSAKKAIKTNAPPAIETFLDSTQHIEDWTRTEKVALQAEISGAAPHHIMFPEEIMGKIRKVEIPAVSEIEPGNSDIAWFCVLSIEKKVTKTGKTFLRLKVVDSTLKTCWIRVWGDVNDKLVPYSIWMANVNHEINWGISTNIGKMKYLDC